MFDDHRSTWIDDVRAERRQSNEHVNLPAEQLVQPIADLGARTTGHSKAHVQAPLVHMHSICSTSDLHGPAAVIATSSGRTMSFVVERYDESSR
jgi:hypothetical protein